ncbi:GNAT family N-acetyltransferase [Bacillus horti]|uniref:Ribosomal protein S18 acetylase RimI-like enzyme n=1 Tax=Caldalkalibacillus horti TaxID=77523 RepID=A0ABT9VXA3_9BACI|nr:GNAT family N-acetyltransferase [Bacillus horti]MDQ0165623.1 ribosomal protein S18 acetylase RimI-like enzyme [Bacillus horti]
MIKRLCINEQKIAEQVLDIQKQAYRIEADLIGFDQIPPLMETINELKHSEEEYIGLYEEEELIGVLAYETELLQDNTVSITICKLVVHPGHFRKGIASILINHLAVLSRNTSSLIVSTGAKNKPAIQLYEKLGFKEIGEIEINNRLTLKEFKKNIKVM